MNPQRCSREEKILLFEKILLLTILLFVQVLIMAGKKLDLTPFPHEVGNVKPLMSTIPGLFGYSMMDGAAFATGCFAEQV